jgi:uncharacterized protein YegP (UPF0339 family)
MRAIYVQYRSKLSSICRDVLGTLGSKLKGPRSMAIEFRIRKSTSKAQPYYWDIYDEGNHTVLADSETYVNKQDAITAAYSVQVGAAAAKIIDET